MDLETAKTIKVVGAKKTTITASINPEEGVKNGYRRFSGICELARGKRE